jgi:putative ABC transport system substrate-binding protein
MRQDMLRVVLLCVALVLVGCPGRPSRPTGSSVRTITIPAVTPVSHPSLDAAIRGFRDQLTQGGGDSVRYNVVVYNANEQRLDLTTILAKVISTKPPLFFVVTTGAAQEAVQKAKEAGIPMVYAAVTEPCSAKIVTSMDRSETPVTGVSDRYPVKAQVEFFASVLPSARSYAVLYCPAEDNSKILSDETQRFLTERGLKADRIEVATKDEIELKVGRAATQYDALVVNGDNLLVNNLDNVLRIATDARKPVFTGDCESVKRGALAAYGPDYYGMGELAGKKALVVLAGTKPGDVPSSYPTTFTYSLNVATAKSIGIPITSDVLGVAGIWTASK